MNLEYLLTQIVLGEDSTRQFKVDIKNAESLASEMAALANTNGCIIFIGVADDGSMPGLSAQDVGRVNQLISNAASHLVHSPLAVLTENVAIGSGRIAIVLTVPKGIDRMDKLRFRDFLRDVYKMDYPDSLAELTRLLQNMNLATDDGMLNLAGVLLFAEQPEWIVPQFVVKAIRYPGNKIHGHRLSGYRGFFRSSAEAL